MFDLFEMFERVLLEALGRIDAVLSRAQYVAEGAVFESSWIRASLFPLFISGSLCVPYLVLAVCASNFAATNMWVTFAFITAMLGAMDQEHAAVRATATLTEENLQIQRLNAFVSLVRRTFHNLPANARFAGGVRAEGGDGFPEITLRDAPGVFAWGMGGPSAGTALLTARPRLGGGRELSLMLLPGSLGEMERRDALERGAWLRLLPDLREVKWRFYNAEQQEWLE